MEPPIPDHLAFPLFFSMFGITYFVGSLVFRNWSPKHRPDATSCFISLLHGTPAVALAVAALLSHPAPGFAAPNTHFQNLVLDFSTAYFTVDLLHYLILLPGDVLFIAHHLATLFVFLTCRHLVLHGAFAILVILAFAEITSFCQNVWTLAGLRRDDTPLADTVYTYLSPPFYALYTVMRVIAGPIFFFKMSAFYLSGKAADVIPLWVSGAWIFVVGGAIAVGILWIFNRWGEFFRERRERSRVAEKKKAR